MDLNLVGTIIAVILTVMIFTYLLGDNPVFRLAEHILIGVSVGWVTLQILFNLMLPAFNYVLDSSKTGSLDWWLYLVPLVLGLLLLFRPLRQVRPVTNLIMAMVIGTVSALALAGAISGTLLPQVGAAMLPLNTGDIIGRIVLLLGTLLALWYFQFTVFKVLQPAPTEGAAANSSGSQAAEETGISSRVRLAGRWGIMLAFGAVFASVFLTYFAALVDRLLFLINLKF
jgi:hypothetical protein